MPDEEYGSVFRLKDKDGNIIKVGCTKAQLKSHWIKKLGYSLVDVKAEVTNDVSADSGTDTATV